MPSYKSSLPGLVVAMACVAVPALAQESAIRVLDPIVVIGERRETSILETNSSVSIYTIDEVERAAGQDVNDVVRSAPNVHTRSVSELPNIRGIEGGGPGGLANTALGGTLPRVPLIVDEVARPASVPNADFTSLWDVEQLEVLRGPQTTLRGRSAIGGAIVLKTADPTFEPEAAGQAVTEFDEFHGPTFGLNAMASGGVVDGILAVRGTFEHRGGQDARNVVNAPVGIDPSDVNDFENTRVRTKVLLTPDGQGGPLSILGIAEVQEGTVPQTRGTVQSTGFSDGRTRSFSDRDIDYVTGGLRIFDTLSWTTAVDASYRVGDLGKIRAIGSFATTDFESLPAQPQNFFFDFDEGVFNQDLLFEIGTAEDRVTGLIGASYTYREQDVRIDNVIPPVLLRGIAALTADGETETASAFADLTVGITDRLDLLAGGRVMWNKDTRTTFSNLLSTPPFNIPAVTTRYDETETVFLPSAGLRFALTPVQSISASARKGWNAGGSAINFFTGAPYTYTDESVWTYEAGYRFESANRRYTFSATAFFSQYDDPQFFLETQPGNRFSIQVVNLPEGETYGAEFDGRAAITREITLRAGIGLLRTEITGSTASNPALQGNEFGKDPDLTVNVGAVYYPDAVPGLSVDLNVVYVGESFNDFNNVDAQRIGGYTLVDVGLGFEQDDVTARVFVNNLFDETGETTRVTNFSAVTPPRTFGASLTMRF